MQCKPKNDNGEKLREIAEQLWPEPELVGIFRIELDSLIVISQSAIQITLPLLG